MDLLIASASQQENLWGLRICERTGLGPGTIYPILERLQRVGWVSSSMEPGRPSGRPPRRYYTVTGTGQEKYRAALDARNARMRRWTSATEYAWLRLSGKAAP
ncbi:PadR family transcriptional regulator [Actinoplanes sp. N902-109]|uniref:PadR family transcriptional regulator n=1 Tax=Actinoplanes sp. (strain N902-109) TaxID=649831 RepID=UPI0012F84351|nr:helix-turn-helix transcriptional regulator [Actinoplanes sp. N902-109]